MENLSDLNEAEEVKLRNIVDMGLTFSAMIRLFEKGSKEKLREKILVEVRNVFKVNSKDDYVNIHSDFCDWGVENILLAKKATAPSFGQIAKTFDVVLKVVVYYSHLPNCEKSRDIAGWLNAAVDTKMMAMLKRDYPNDIRPWPTTVEKVKKNTYMKIQGIVRKFIAEKRSDVILPVQFDDIYWRLLNR